MANDELTCHIGIFIVQRDHEQRIGIKVCRVGRPTSRHAATAFKIHQIFFESARHRDRNQSIRNNREKIHFNDDTLTIEIQCLVLCNNNNKNCWKRNEKKKTDLKRNEREQRRDATATAERSGLTDVRDRSVYVCEYPTAPPLGQRIFFSLFLAVW